MSRPLSVAGPRMMSACLPVRTARGWPVRRPSWRRMRTGMTTWPFELRRTTDADRDIEVSLWRLTWTVKAASEPGIGDCTCPGYAELCVTGAMPRSGLCGVAWAERADAGNPGARDSA